MNSIKTKTSLENLTLDIENSDIDDDGFKFIAETIEQSLPNLRKIHLLFDHSKCTALSTDYLAKAFNPKK